MQPSTMKFIGLIFLAVIIPATGFGGGRTVSIATLEDYAPFCFSAGNQTQLHQTVPVGGKAEDFYGYSWDVVRSCFHEMGYTIHLTIAPWARAMQYFREGRVEVLFPAGKNSERERLFFFSGENVNQARFLVYLRAGDPLEWQGLESLKGLKIGQKRGFNYGDSWRAATAYIRTYDISTILQGFEMLDGNRLDGFLGYELNWDYVLAQAGWKSKFRKLPSFGSTAEHVVALKTNPRALELLNAFDTGKKRIIENGTLKEIETRWTGAEQSPPPREPGE